MAFSDNDFDDLCNEVLTAIEIREAQLLNWGFVEVSSDLNVEIDDLLATLQTGIDKRDAAIYAGYRSVDILTNLRERKLIFRNIDSGRYRSRFAETIRLLYYLRQRFDHLDWKTSSRLVSDLKIFLRRRRYPKRNIHFNALIDELRTEFRSGLPRLAEPIIRQLLFDSEQPIALSSFQKNAVLQIFRSLSIDQSQGIVIGAGTGSGKTKAFYIPALAHIASEIRSDEYSLKALAIYPRNVLLIDQMGEAYREARKLDALLIGLPEVGRPLLIGAYYGGTPQNAKAFNRSSSYIPDGWKWDGNIKGWKCPFMNCPICGQSTLFWQDTDLDQITKKQNEYARLTCMNENCGEIIGPDKLLLTREQMRVTPPDILFTTTEMLNRSLSHPNEHQIFGIGSDIPKPRLLLLDEIHTYEGLAGAQVAYLLRRWQHARGQRPSLCIVGLSATLTQAESFFSELTGIPPFAIHYISPSVDDLVEEGMEYNIVLNGDPVSGVSLLSTSVQTAMLIGRILDPAPRGNQQSVSHDAYGQKTFAFTDSLDSINRWYHIERDAEERKTLSQFRQVTNDVPPAEQALRRSAGQIWDVPMMIGHDLKQPLVIGRTSSQDRGVDSNARLIIASSSLEVGFNDEAVGAIIQHRTARSTASFLQRKGRAGRRRKMRPWMIVVTSAFGRDRWTFQHAESLFEPEIPPLNLPIDNYYVQKIQAVYALMDWLASKSNINVWTAFSSSHSRSQQSQYRERLVQRLKPMLIDERVQNNLRTYLMAALRLNDDQVDAVFWDEPRSLIFDVIPTILRQLATDWQKVQHGGVVNRGDVISDNPLPEFIPAALFADLNLPEATLKIPGTRRLETMPILQAMRDIAPGRVTKRFATSNYTRQAHWLTIPDLQQTHNDSQLAIDKLKIESLPARMININGKDYLLYRPYYYELDEKPDDLKDTSYAELVWKSSFVPQMPSARLNRDTEDTPRDLILALTQATRWSQLIEKIEVYTQTAQQWVEVTRLAAGLEVDIRAPKKDGRRVNFEFIATENNPTPSGFGFVLSVDGFRLKTAPLDIQVLKRHPQWREFYRHCGPQFFYNCLQNDVRLKDAGLSRFQIDWLWLLEYSMIVATAIAQQATLRAAFDTVNARRMPIAKRTMEVIFQSQIKASDEDDSEDSGKLFERLMMEIQKPTVQEALNEAVQSLWDDSNPQLDHWLQNCYQMSIGATIMAALLRLAPEVDDSDLVMDIDDQSIWITETVPGGIGIISRLTSKLVEHPHDFELLLQDTVQHCDRDHLARQLHETARLIGQGDADLKAAFAAVRSNNDLPTLLNSQALLTKALEQQGVSTTRSLMVALNSRFLRPNSDAKSDLLIAQLVQLWDDEESRLGCEIDVRVLAVAAVQRSEIKQPLQALLTRISGSDAPIQESQYFNLLQSLLWTRCAHSCPDCIEYLPTFFRATQASRALLQVLLAKETLEIVYGAPEWDKYLRTALQNVYAARVICNQDQLVACKVALIDLLANPIELGYQAFYPSIERIERYRLSWFVDIALREMLGE